MNASLDDFESLQDDLESLPDDLESLCSAPPLIVDSRRTSTSAEAPVSFIPSIKFDDSSPCTASNQGQDESDIEPDITNPLPSTCVAKTALLQPHGLAPFTTTLDNTYVFLFFRFCAERHRMWVIREEKYPGQAGAPRHELTQDETMQRMSVGNVFRELDGGSACVREEIVLRGDQSHEEICFRIFLYCGFYSSATWQALVDGLGEIPTWRSFGLERYEAILYQNSTTRREKIYYGGFQLVPPTIYFGGNLPHFAATLRFVKSLMEMGMPEKLLKCIYAVDTSQALQTVPTLGGFLSLNMLCYLNESPHLNFSYRNFATCGPGPRSNLKRIFGKAAMNSLATEEAGLKWLYENQWRYWARLGEDPPHAWTLGIRPGMRVLDVENALCWCHRYVNEFTSKGWGSLFDLPAPAFSPEADSAGMPAWCEAQATGGVNKIAFVDDYEETAAQLAEVDDGVYEVEKVVSRIGARDSKDGLFRVRWKGYAPEWDTWEKASALKDSQEIFPPDFLPLVPGPFSSTSFRSPLPRPGGSRNSANLGLISQALDDFLAWEKNVWATISRIAKGDPHRGPASTPTTSSGRVQQARGKSSRTRNGQDPTDRTDVAGIKSESEAQVVSVLQVVASLPTSGRKRKRRA